MDRVVARSTLSEAIDGAESRLFVGREDELAALHELLDLSWRHLSIGYINGPTGVGKSGLLRAFARSVRADGIPVAMIDGRTVETSPVGFASAVARQLEDLWPEDAAASLHEVASLVGRLGGERGFVLLIDDYDRLGAMDRVLREVVFQHLERGVCLVLSGCLPPAAVWSADPVWRSLVCEVRLSGLPARHAAELLQRRGSTEIWDVDAVLALTAGRPLHLATVADALTPVAGRTLPAHPASEADVARVMLRAVEHMLHPSSRRHTWRAGIGSSAIDRTLAAVALLRRFNRGDLAAMVGREAADAVWADLVDLPFVEPAGPMYRLIERVRRVLAQAVARHRPWAEVAWRQRALEWRLATYDDQADESARPSWGELADLARECPWHRTLYPASEWQCGWQVGQGARTGDAPELLACFEAMQDRLGHWADPAEGEAARQGLSRLLAEWPQGFLIARDPHGVPAGFLAAAPLVPELLAPAGALAVLPEPLRRAVSYAPGERPAGLLLAAGCAGAREHPAELFAVLLREACDVFRGAELVVAAVPAAWADRLGLGGLLAGLGFAAPIGAASSHPGGGSPWLTWTLDISGGYAAWLRRILQPAPDSHAGDVQAAAREALSALHNPDKLLQTAVGRRLAERFGVRSANAVRAWMLDAMSEADLGSFPVSCRVLLTLYYVDRVGSHDLVAEKLNISRPTYFRYHRQALQRFGASLLR